MYYRSSNTHQNFDVVAAVVLRLSFGSAEANVGIGGFPTGLFQLGQAFEAEPEERVPGANDHLVWKKIFYEHIL